MSENSKPAELRASSSFSQAIPEDALCNGTCRVAVAKEKGESGMEALPGLTACQCCRKFGTCVTFTIPCQEDKLSAEERHSTFSMIMSAVANQQSKPLPLPKKKGKGPNDRGNWRLSNDLIDFLALKNLGLDGRVEKTSGRQIVNTLSDVFLGFV